MKYHIDRQMRLHRAADMTTRVRNGHVVATGLGADGGCADMS